jgi:hypothetical protein
VLSLLLLAYRTCSNGVLSVAEMDAFACVPPLMSFFSLLKSILLLAFLLYWRSFFAVVHVAAGIPALIF